MRIPCPATNTGRFASWSQESGFLGPIGDGVGSVQGGRRRERRQGGFVDERALHIERHVEPHGAGATGAGKEDGFLELLARVARIAKGRRVLRDRAHDVDDVDLLVAQLSEGKLWASRDRRLLLHLPGQVDHRHRVEPLADDSGQRIGATRAAGHHRQPEPVSRPRITLGRDRRRLLVMVADVANAAPPDRIVEVHGTAAGHQESMLYAESLERSNKIVCYANHVVGRQMGARRGRRPRLE